MAKTAKAPRTDAHSVFAQLFSPRIQYQIINKRADFKPSDRAFDKEEQSEA